MTDVTIIIPCRNEEAHIDACLASIVSQKGLTENSEVLVIDGESDDSTADRVKKWQAKDSRIRLLTNSKRHVSAALNLGISIATNDVVVRIDGHTEYADDYVMTCVQVLDETGADNVGGPARTRGTGYIHEAIRFAYHHPFVVGGARFHDVNYEGEVDTVTYGCWRRSTLVDIGAFDENFIRNQDDELNFRLKKSGGVIWQSPRIRSWYKPRSTFRAVAKQYYQYGYWKAKVMQKHGRPASLRHVVPGVFVASLILSATLSLFIDVAQSAFIVSMLSYLAFIAVTSLSIATAAHRYDLLPVLPMAIASFQLPYGIGFLVGWIDIGIRSTNRKSMTELSR